MSGDIREDPFPAKSKEATGLVGGTPTEVTSTPFADKILITISQGGRLSQWVQVPLIQSTSGAVDLSLPGAAAGNSDLSLLPATHLTPTTLLGGGGDERETFGRLYAAQIASQITARAPDDRRVVLVGLGLAKLDGAREAFFDMLELVQSVL